MDTTSTNASLAERIQAGDSSAEEELARVYGRALFAIAKARTGDVEAARDLAQQALLETLKALRRGGLRETDKVSAFVQGIVRNLASNFLRTRARRSEYPLDSVQLNTEDPVKQHESAERQRLVQRQIRS